MKAMFSEWETPAWKLGLPDEWGQGCITYTVLVTTERAESHYGQPVVVIDGVTRGPGEMPPGEIQVADPALAEELRQLGYQVTILAAEEQDRYWVEAADRPVYGHWHPEARWVRY